MVLVLVTQNLKLRKEVQIVHRNCGLKINTSMLKIVHILSFDALWGRLWGGGGYEIVHLFVPEANKLTKCTRQE